MTLPKGELMVRRARHERIIAPLVLSLSKDRHDVVER